MILDMSLYQRNQKFSFEINALYIGGATMCRLQCKTIYFASRVES